MRIVPSSVRGILFLLLLPACGTVFAQQTEEERPYDASASLGYVGTSGNTEVTTLNTEFQLEYRHSSWVHNAELRTLTSQEDSVTKAERYFLADKSDYTFDGEEDYVYVQGSYTDDRFSGFGYQATLSTGYGRYFIRDDEFILEGYSGIGYRQNDIENQGTQGEVVFSLGENFDWQLGDTSALSQSLLTQIGEERTITTFQIGLQSQIMGSLSTEIAFEARHSSQVPVGREKTDTQTSVNLVYTF